MKKRRKTKAPVRYRMDLYFTGECEGRHHLFSGEDREIYRNSHYQSVEAAVESFLSHNWDFATDPDVPEPDKISETLFQDTALVVDLVEHRVVAMLAFRWPEIGESRAAVAMIIDLPSGTTRLQTVEQYQTRQAA